jgi:hypothetical protein
MRIHLVRGHDRPLPMLGWLAFATFWLVLCALAAWEVVFEQSAFR